MSVTVLHNWRYSVGKLLYATPVYRYTLLSRAPRDLIMVPPDAWPGSADRGAAIVNGEGSTSQPQTSKRNEAIRVDH